MPHVHLTALFPRDRDRTGMLRVEQDGLLLAEFPALGRGSRGGGDTSLLEDGNTPVGDYVGTGLESTAHRNQNSYGPWGAVRLSPVGGHALLAERFGHRSGLLIHGGSVYDEEVHIPFMIENPVLFPRAVTVDRVMRQVDIAPTLLALLGFAAPAAWQGANALGGGLPPRAYFFAGTGNPTFGLVEGNFKYIYNFPRRLSQLYDLAADPKEKNDLASDPAYAQMIARDHLRLEAWVSFQNPYLERFEKFARADR